MSPRSIEDILRRVSELPPLPTAVTRLCALADDPETDARDMAGAISTDQALTARILRVANSAFYGLSRRVTTVSHAMVILGFRTVKNLALSSSIVGSEVDADEESALPREGFWRHSLSVASAARALTKYMLPDETEEIFVAGLIHDIGKRVFMKHFSDQYASLVQSAADGAGPLSALEEEAFGMNHAEAGKYLCEHWNIPDSLAQAVAFHHHPVKRDPPVSDEEKMTHVVSMANGLAKIMQTGFGGNPYVDTDPFLDLDEEKMPRNALFQILLALPEETQKADAFFDLAPATQDDDPPKKEEPAPVAVLLKDGPDREIVTMTLLSMGYAPLVPDQTTADPETACAGVLFDEAAPAEQKDALSSGGAPSLDFAQWKEEHADPDHTSLHIDKLRRWLEAELSRRTAEEAA